MRKKYVVTEVMAAFAGIPNLPEKEVINLEDIQSSLPNLFTGTAYEADTYEVSFLGYFKTKAIVFVNPLNDRELSFSPIAAYTYYGAFSINGVYVLVSFRATQSKMIFIVKLQKSGGRSDKLEFEEHELVGNKCIMVKRAILART